MKVMRQIDSLRTHVFLTQLPGMTLHRERLLIQSCRALARTAMAAGIPPSEAWRPVGQFIDRMVLRIRTEHERETFVAVMQRVRRALFDEFESGMRGSG